MILGVVKDTNERLVQNREGYLGGAPKHERSTHVRSGGTGLQAEGRVGVGLGLACSLVWQTSVAHKGRERRCSQDGHGGRWAVPSCTACWDDGNVPYLRRLLKPVTMK